MKNFILFVSLFLFNIAAANAQNNIMNQFINGFKKGLEEGTQNNKQAQINSSEQNKSSEPASTFNGVYPKELHGRWALENEHPNACTNKNLMTVTINKNKKAYPGVTCTALNGFGPDSKGIYEITERCQGGGRVQTIPTYYNRQGDIMAVAAFVQVQKFKRCK